MPNQRSYQSLWRYLAGTALLVHGGLPVIQTLRSWRYTDHAHLAYHSTWLNDTPIEFGGHIIQVRDTLPRLQLGSRHEREDLVGIELDGREVLSPRRVNVSLTTIGISRYHLWINAQIVRDRATDERLLVVSRRVPESPADNPTIEVLQVTERGAVSTLTLTAADRRSSLLTYVMLDMLTRDVTLFPYQEYLSPFRTSFMPLGMLLLTLPFVSIGGGLWLIVRTARSRSAQTPHPPESPSS